MPKKLEGNIKIPPSKSLSHRAIIAASLAIGESIIKNVQFSCDITATIKSMASLGADIKVENASHTLKINGTNTLKNIKNFTIDAKESGSTLRFLMPIALISNREFTFIGEGNLPKRPLDPYFDIFKKNNIPYQRGESNLPLNIKGPLLSGTFYLDGNISSQFISGLLMALPLLKEDSKIVINKKLESKAYVDLTIDTLDSFGIKVENKNYEEFIIKGSQKYIPSIYEIEGDFSQGAFFIAASALGSNIKVLGLNMNSKQSDKVIIDIISKMTKSSKDLHGITIDISECPDLFPILTILGCFAFGETKIINGKRVRLKECDRIHCLVLELKKLGADIKETEDGAIINGPCNLKGGICSSHNDHRIAMALSIISTKINDILIITDSKCVNKSYPDFFYDFKSLGGEVYERNMGK